MAHSTTLLSPTEEPTLQSPKRSSDSSSSLPPLQAISTPPPPYSSTGKNEQAPTTKTQEQRRTIRFELNKPPTMGLPESDVDIGKISTPKKATAKSIGKATWKVTKTILGGALGCLGYILYKACILDGGGAVGGGKVAVTAGAGGSRPRAQPRSIRLCEEDMTARNTARNSARPRSSVSTERTVRLSSTASRSQHDSSSKTQREHIECVRSGSRC